MVKEIIRVGKQADGGFTDYVYPKEGETDNQPKRSYSKAFAPLNGLSEQEIIRIILMKNRWYTVRICGLCAQQGRNFYWSGHCS